MTRSAAHADPIPIPIFAPVSSPLLLLLLLLLAGGVDVDADVDSDVAADVNVELAVPDVPVVDAAMVPAARVVVAGLTGQVSTVSK